MKDKYPGWDKLRPCEQELLRYYEGWTATGEPLAIPVNGKTQSTIPIGTISTTKNVLTAVYKELIRVRKKASKVSERIKQSKGSQKPVMEAV